MLFGKPMESEFLAKPGGAETWLKCPVVTGKVTEEKINKALGWWATHLDALYPELNPEDTIFDVPAKRLLQRTPIQDK